MYTVYLPLGRTSETTKLSLLSRIGRTEKSCVRLRQTVEQKKRKATEEMIIILKSWEEIEIFVLKHCYCH